MIATPPPLVAEEMCRRADDMGIPLADLQERVEAQLARSDPALDELDRWLAAIEAAAPRVDLWKKKVLPSGDVVYEPDRAAFVAVLLRDRHFVAPDDTGELLVYAERGIYEAAGPIVEKWIEREFARKEMTSGQNFRNEVVGAIRALTYRPRASLNPPGLICLSNGVLNTASFEVTPHTPATVFTARLEVAYDPAATSPTWDRVLAEWQPDAGVREFLEEWVGYGLEDGYPHQVSLVNVGGGDNGKGVFLGVICALFTGALAAETLTTLNSRFGPASLYGALVNVADELPAGEITDSSKFKAVTGGSLIRGERKGQDPFMFVNRAKLTFAANQLPKVSDRSRAFWRRVILVRWEFLVSPGNRDVRLDEKLRAELPGILNRAIAGLVRLRARGTFAQVPTVAEAAEAWRRSSDSLAYFVDQLVERDPKETVTKTALMTAYRLFCENRDLEADRDSYVGSRLPELLPGVHAERPRVGGRQVAVWKGIRLRKTARDASNDGFEQGEEGEEGGSRPGNVDRSLEGWGRPPPLTPLAPLNPENREDPECP